MSLKARSILAAVVATAIFWSGWAVGQNKFGRPNTVIHVVSIKWKADAPEAERQKALNGVADMAAQIPGIKNIWIKSTRVQPSDYNAAFVIEFENREAADRYAEHPAHKAWQKHYLEIREQSRSLQITN